MPKTRAQKEQNIIELKEMLANAKSVVFADYRGLNMAQLSDLRNKLREVGGTLTITKNTLLKMSLPTNYQLPTTYLFEGPTATLIATDDEISPIKLLVKALKDAGIGKIKAGFLGTEALDEAKINQLATLPGKDELRGKVVGVLVAPLHGLVGVLQGNIRNLVYAVDQIRIQKSSFAPNGATADKEGGV